MVLTRKTVILAGVVVLLVLLLLVGRSGPDAGESLPSLPAVDESQVTRLTILRSAQTVVIEKDGDAWKIVQPLQASADASSIRGLLAVFHEPLKMDVQIDKGNLDKYDADDQKGITFEVFTGGREPVISLVVGKDLAGGASAVRLAGSDVVYSAQVGGRFRYDKDPDAWRNRALLDVDADNVVALTFDRPGGALAFARRPAQVADDSGKVVYGPWFTTDAPDFPLDQRLVGSLARSLCTLRANEVHAAGYGSGWDDPLGLIELAFSDGSTHHLVVVPANDEHSVLLRIDDRSDVFRVSASVVQRALQPLSDFRDRTLFSFARTDVDAIGLEEGNRRVRIRQDAATGAWKVVEPISADADQRTALATAAGLGTLRAVDIASGVDAKMAGLEKPNQRFLVDLVDGSRKVLEIGARFKDAAGNDSFFVRRSGDGTVYVLRADTVSNLRKAFLKS
jgi:hypothetical protein